MSDVRVIAVAVIVRDGVATIYDRNCVGVTSLSIDRIAGLPDTAQLEWSVWARGASQNKGCAAIATANRLDPWKRKAENLQAAWGDRIYQASRVKNSMRCRVQPPGSATWRKAASLMSHQMSRERDKQRDRDSNVWMVWAATASVNNNKRAKKYAKN